MRESNTKLNLKKMELVKTSIQFLGHELRGNSIRPVKSYTEAIAKWEVPKLKTEARSFLGLVGYYRWARLYS